MAFRDEIDDLNEEMEDYEDDIEEYVDTELDPEDDYDKE